MKTARKSTALLFRMVGFLLLSATTQNSWATGPCTAKVESLLSHVAIQSLRAAQASGAYEVEILTKSVGNQKKTIVLLGESHIKNQTSSGLGKDVLKHFELRGLEGANSKALMGGWVIDKVMSVVGAAARTLSFGKRKLSAGSTIQDAEGVSEQELSRALLEFLKSVETEMNLKTMPSSELEKVRIEINGTLS